MGAAGAAAMVVFIVLWETYGPTSLVPHKSSLSLPAWQTL
jgi:hypothetical protein